MSVGRVLVLGAVTCLAGCGGGNGNKATDGGASDGGDGGAGGQYAQYDTLTGTFQSGSGIHATFSGAMQGASVGAYGSWVLEGGYDEQTAPVVPVSSPAGSTATVGIAIQNILGGSLSAATYTCDEAEDAGTPTINIEFGLTDSAVVYGAATSLQSGGPCSLTFESPSLVKAPTLYFAHGSMTATLVGTLADGGTDVGTMTATW
jgi:hypothetical protein